jgi:RNA binding exosome subunit
MIRGIELKFFGYSTEDQLKVRKAARNILPTILVNAHIEYQELKGYFGGSITSYVIRIKNRKEAKITFNHLIKNLSSLDKSQLIHELNQRIDKTRNLYFRLDKQKAYLGKTVLNRHDAIRVKVKLHLNHKDDPIETMGNYIRGITI